MVRRENALARAPAKRPRPLANSSQGGWEGEWYIPNHTHNAPPPCMLTVTFTEPTAKEVQEHPQHTSTHTKGWHERLATSSSHELVATTGSSHELVATTHTLARAPGSGALHPKPIYVQRHEHGHKELATSLRV